VHWVVRVCRRCGFPALVPQRSGARAHPYACRPCLRSMAASPYAPPWVDAALAEPEWLPEEEPDEGERDT
jgi:hypothetical protein